MPVPSAITDLSQTAGSNYPSGGESPITADNYFQAYASFIALLRDGKGNSTQATLASATTTDIGGQNSLYVSVTGTTTITGFGTNYTGPRFVSFTGILTLTHSATLVCPGAANITTAANDSAIAIPISGGWQIVAYQKASGLPVSTTGLAPLASPTFTGVPAGPTAAAATNTTQLATTAFVQQEVPAASTTAAGKVELATNAEVVTGTDTSRAVVPAALHAGKSVLGTLTASTSGTAINFTGIPAWAKRITVMFNAMSTNGTSPPTVRIGDSGGVEATGYLGTTLTFANASPVGSVSSTTGFDLINTNASGIVYHGAIVITLMDAATNLWVCSGVVNRSDAGAGQTLGYNKSLSATLDRVQITTNNGTDTFDAGSVNILYE